jgi:flagellar hook-associated protein FlgK
MTPANHLSADVDPPLSTNRIFDLADIARTAIALIPAADMPATLTGQLEAAIALPANAAVAAELREALAYAERDVNQFMARIIAATTPAALADLRREVERDFQAQSHNYRAHMWSINNAMIPQVQMNFDRIVNSVVTMINDALTGYLRGENGHFIFYETDANGQPLLAYEYEYMFDANGNRMLNADGTPIRNLLLDSGGNPVPIYIFNPVTGQMEQDRVPRYAFNQGHPQGVGIPLFVRDSDIVRNTTTGVTTVNWTWPVSQHENPNSATTIFTTGNIRINPDFLVAGGHNNLALSLSGAPGDTDLLVALQKIWNLDKGPYAIKIGERLFNAQNAYIRFTGEIATETNDAKDKVKSQTIQVDQAQHMRMAVKGVSMDEEMSAMLRFQFAFQAASRAFNVIDSMIDRLINGTGRVGL